MKSNWFKYVFIIFIVVLLLFAIYKIRKDEEEKQIEQTQAVNGQEEKITELKLGIARARYYESNSY